MTHAETPKLDFEKAAQRVKLYAETIGVSPPARLLCDEGAPAPELMAFCHEFGASLDWIFLGDVRGMIRDSYKLAMNKQQMQEAGE